jgi:hypothetical protein
MEEPIRSLERRVERTVQVLGDLRAERDRLRRRIAELERQLAGAGAAPDAGGSVDRESTLRSLHQALDLLKGI